MIILVEAGQEDTEKLKVKLLKQKLNSLKVTGNEMKAIILKSKPDTQFHFGKSVIDAETALDDTSPVFHSDSLWSALVAKSAEIDENSPEIIIKWFQEDKIRISSLMFCLAAGNNYIFFQPKPVSLNLSNPNSKDEIEFPDHKKLKKIKYLSKGIHEKGIEPKDWTKEEKCIIIQNEFVLLKEELELFGKSVDINFSNLNFYQTESIPKVRVPNICDEKDARNFYHQTNVQLINETNFNVQYYFLVDSELSDSDWQKFEYFLRYLFEFGIGGELSTGCGQIEGYEICEFHTDIADTGYYFSTSLTIPDTDEIDNCQTYQLNTRGGRTLGNEHHIKMINMMNEGAVFNKKINGKIVSLSDSNIEPVLRCGMPLLLPLHKNFTATFEKEKL
jgi:CRISPR-associated protein Csm4